MATTPWKWSKHALPERHDWRPEQAASPPEKIRVFESAAGREQPLPVDAGHPNAPCNSRTAVLIAATGGHAVGGHASNAAATAMQISLGTVPAAVR